ncbi:hypothetical protein GCM10023340_41140 [Nocardioides marinquilinus]|uniref:DUF2568 domain-containing protein n=1 Tax=Nocardioides marinquilinus TaxID=1210400 RepID=A0ABP9Q5C3_9ACTN
MPFKVMAAVLLMITGATTFLFLGGTGIDGVAAATFLFENGAVLYGIGVVWIVAAPVPLLVAALFAGRTPGPWVVVVTVHLAVLLVLLLRLRAYLSGTAFLGWGCFAVLGLLSILAVTLDRPRPSPAVR